MILVSTVHSFYFGKSYNINGAQEKRSGREQGRMGWTEGFDMPLDHY